MKIYIDADGCPVVDATIALAKKYGVECIVLCDTCHVFEKMGARTITVSKGADSVDFALVNLLQEGDIAITQDYGLAAMCLAKKARPINQDGMVYSNQNIDALLQQRYAAKQIRKAGGRFKSRSKRTKEQDKLFKESLSHLLQSEY